MDPRGSLLPALANSITICDDTPAEWLMPWIQEGKLTSDEVVHASGRPDSFLGGLRWVGGNATWPLVRLELDTEGMRVRPSARLLSPLLPEWRFGWDEVLLAERVHGLLFGSAGVRFSIRGRKYPFTFWYSNPQRVLDALTRRGVPVDANKHRVGLMGM